MSVIEHMELLKLKAFFRAEERGELPAYLGSTLRGILGHCLRRFVCIRPGQKCFLCDVAHQCAYAQSFNSPGNRAGAVNPFVLYAPVRDKTSWEAGDTCEFDLTVIGDATRLAGFYVDGLTAMSERGWGARRMRFSLQHIVNAHDNTLVWSGGKTWGRHLKPARLSGAARHAAGVLIRFDTPTRVLTGRELCRRLDFFDIAQSIIRRIGLLSHAYTGRLMEWDEADLLEKARRIRTVEEQWRFVDFKRYSINHQEKLSLPAIEGWARFEGDLAPFTELLEAGRYVHLGKNATHGFGHYRLMYS